MKQTKSKAGVGSKGRETSANANHNREVEEDVWGESGKVEVLVEREGMEGEVLPVNNGLSQCMISIFQQIRFTNLRIFITIQLKELTIDDIEVFITEII